MKQKPATLMGITIVVLSALILIKRGSLDTYMNHPTWFYGLMFTALLGIGVIFCARFLLKK